MGEDFFNGMVKSWNTTQTQNTETIKKDNFLRPQGFDEFIGQKKVIKPVKISITASKHRGEALEHHIFYGPPGVGKTTLAFLIAKEMEAPNFISLLGPQINTLDDLVPHFNNLHDGCILFIDEVHSIRRKPEEALHSVMQEGMYMDGHMEVAVGKITVLGATTMLDKVGKAFLARFTGRYKLQEYSDQEIAEILAINAQKLEIDNFTKKGLMVLAKASRGNPRIGNHHLRFAKDYITVERMEQKDYDLKLNGKRALKALHTKQVDALGLEDVDRELLIILRGNRRIKHGKRIYAPMGIDTLSQRMNMESATLNSIVEPFLLRIGLIERHQKGRVITRLGRNYLKEYGSV